MRARGTLQFSIFALMKPDYRKQVFLLMAFSLVIRGIVAAVTELGNDEVYYWTYALFPDWSHFDHPPMLGWVIRFFTLDLMWDGAFALRLPALILGTLNIWIIYRIGILTGNPRTGWYAALLYTGSVYASVLAGTFILPDTPLGTFYLAALFYFLKACGPKNGHTSAARPVHFLTAGVFAGLAMLSKYTGVFLWAGILPYLLLFRRNTFKTPWLWAGMGISLLLFFPVILWNLAQAQSSFSFHSQRIIFFGEGLKLFYFGREVLGLFFYHNPINVGLMVWSRWARMAWAVAAGLGRTSWKCWARSSRPAWTADAVVIGVSQSGQSPDIIAVVEEGARQGALTVAVTNAPDSPLALAADFVLSVCAGPERAVAATKSYTAQLGALALLAVQLAGDEERLNLLRSVPDAVSRTLDLEDSIERYAQRYTYATESVVLGRGYNYSTAFEIALKLKEQTYMVVEPYSSADFRHGPVAIVDQGFPAIVIAPDGAVYSDMMALAGELAERGAELIVISDQDEALNLATTPLRLPVTVPEWLSPFTCIVPGQLLALHITQAKGYEVDSPRGLKKVTVTR